MATPQTMAYRATVNTNSEITGANIHTWSEFKPETDTGGGENEIMGSSSVWEDGIIQTLTKNIPGVGEQLDQEQESAQSDQALGYKSTGNIKAEAPEEDDEEQKLDYEMPCEVTSMDYYNTVVTEAVSLGKNLLLRETDEKHSSYTRGKEDPLKLEAHIKSEGITEFVECDAFSKLAQEKKHDIKNEMVNKTRDDLTYVIRSGDRITEQELNEGGELVKCCQTMSVGAGVPQNSNSMALCNINSESSAENVSLSREIIQGTFKELNVSRKQKCDKKFVVKKHFICKFCDVQFAESTLLQTHLLEAHNKAFTKLILNKITHTDEKRHKCDVCGTAFSRSDYLKMHKRIHTGEKPYICEVCGNAFSRSFDLKLHKRIHTGDVPYKCDFCSKAFSRSSILKTHKRVHTGEKPYKCDVCFVEFAQSGSLKRHRRIHT